MNLQHWPFSHISHAKANRHNLPPSFPFLQGMRCIGAGKMLSRLPACLIGFEMRKKMGVPCAYPLAGIFGCLPRCTKRANLDFFFFAFQTHANEEGYTNQPGIIRNEVVMALKKKIFVFGCALRRIENALLRDKHRLTRHIWAKTIHADTCCVPICISRISTQTNSNVDATGKRWHERKRKILKFLMQM